jgi:hypothetical protein
MGKYTKKQRNKIYRKAHKILTSEQEYGCYAIVRAIDRDFNTDEVIGHIINSKNFPEFFRFRDSTNSMWLGRYDDMTSPYHKAGNEIRQDVLSFCVEMTND